jgi:small GTP-binding protein|tara:strand:+ start:103 stop:729 length:627 start_codon:yes stop_codon:yes gene_type:complete
MKYTFKIIIVGNTGVGKSSLLLKYTRNTFSKHHETTIGVDFATKMIDIPINGEIVPVKLQLWDTAGQEKFRTITNSYYRNCCAAIIVFDLTNRDSFTSVHYWIDNVINGAGENTTIILIGNKCDLDNREVSESDILALINQYDIKYFETSATQQDTTCIAFNILAQDVLLRVHGSKDIPCGVVAMHTVTQESLLPRKKHRKANKCCKI